jgi:hypothetical protein
LARTIVVLLAIALVFLAGLAIQRARMRGHQTPGYIQGR